MTDSTSASRPEVAAHNREAWDRLAHRRDRWTLPVEPERVAAARRGEWSIQLTNTLPVPREWFGQLDGARVLGLAASGGQQGPILAAAGARVTVLDNSPAQLEQDRLVAAREDLELRLEQGDMRDLSRFDDESFDLVVHPVSNCFVPDVLPVWREAYRVLAPGGRLLAGFLSPLWYMVGLDEEEARELRLRYPSPYSDLEHLPAEVLQAQIEKGEPLEFGHSLEQQIGGQLTAGFRLAGMYEDSDPSHPLATVSPGAIATLAFKPSTPTE